MIVFDGLAPYYVLPNWIILIFIEVITILVEVGFILVYSYVREEPSIIEICFVVIGSNLITMIFGVLFWISFGGGYI